EAEATTLQVAMSVAVVDAGDQLVAFARMDGADLVGVRLAQDKAYTALVNRMSTAGLAELVQPGAEFYGYDSVAAGRMIVFAGGMPLERDGVLVGAIGVSGGSAAEDQRAVEAAVRTFTVD
ncbi:MAG TPA: heme-binding protein, partial [Candidatus Limnocylindria bacterium]